MNMLKILSVLIVFGLLAVFSDGYSQVKKNSYGKQFGYFELSPYGGVLFPVGEMNNTYDISGKAGLNVGYRINREVAIYGEFSYNALSSKEADGPTNSYLSITAGPRYYFTNPKLKSAMFLEGGVGAYVFTAESISPSGDPGDPQVQEQGQTRFGVNAGIGGDIYVSENVGIILKTKYNTVLGDNPRSFIGIDGGLNIHF